MNGLIKEKTNHFMMKILYLKNIKLNKNNAFIFRKDLSLPNEVQDSINKKIYDNLHKVR